LITGPKIPIAFFVSSHGFGHAARASAVMNAIFSKWSFVHFEIFTETPEWFFDNSLLMSFNYHFEKTDVGLVQTSPFYFDLNKTIEALSDFLPFNDKKIATLAEKLKQSNCLMVISDISPFGLAVAEMAELPSVLVENFTWDWIYQEYVNKDSRFKEFIYFLNNCFKKADLRIQAEPICESKNAAFRTPPISRQIKNPPEIIRKNLEIKDSDKLVLITMGGIIEQLGFIDQLKRFDEHVYFVVPGTSASLPESGLKQDNVILLPHNSIFYHPDLVNAVDAVIGKVGYSTLAEVTQAGVPFGFIARSDFRESFIFESYIKSNIQGVQILENDFMSGKWIRQIHEILTLGKIERNEPNGANVAADYICNFIACEKEILEIVDTEGCVLGAAPRKSVHGNNELLHRVVHVLVFDNRNRLLLQKRSIKKRVAPGRWDTSVGGHVDCGESIEKALLREMKEELGTYPKSLKFAYQYIHSNDFESELVFTYICQPGGAIEYNNDEIEAVKFWEKQEIIDSLGKGVLSDNFEDEFQRYGDWTRQNNC